MKTNAQINTCAPFLCNQWWSGGLRHTTHKHVIPKDSIVFECKIIFFMTMFFLAFISYSSKLYLHYLFIRKQNLSAITAGQKSLTSSIKTNIVFYLRFNCFRVQNNFCYDNFFFGSVEFLKIGTFLKICCLSPYCTVPVPRGTIQVLINCS